MSNNKQAITKDILVGDLIKEYPKSVGIMLEHGIHCVGCHVATWETLEQSAASHGININKLVKDLNERIETEIK